MMLHVVTLTWDGQEKIERLIPGLRDSMDYLEQQKGIKSKWHVRDNGSKDDTVRIIRERMPGARIFEAGHNRHSFSQGVNSIADKVAEDDFLLLLNNDIQFIGEKNLFRMFDLMEKTKSGAVGARLLYTGTDKLQHAGVIFAKRYNGLPFHYRPGEKTDEQAEKNRFFQAVTAACCLVRGSAWVRVKGLDEGYKWAFEDIDLCLKIGQQDKIAYCGKTKIFHDESATLKRNPVNQMFLSKNVQLFRKKWANKYKLDLETYEKNPNYNEIKD